MKGKQIVSLLLTGAMTAALLAAPAQAAPPSSAVQVGSYKGNTLEVGERSGLIIGPGGADYTVTSSNPDTVAVEQILTFWVAVAKGEGTAEITVSDSTGGRGTLTLTVGSTPPAAPEPPASTASYSEVRQELVRLINQARRENGVPELPVSDALMTAAQSCSDRRYSYHHSREEGQAVAASGYPNGSGSNLTVFTGTAPEDIAQQAVTNWLNSPGHRDTMLDPDCDCLGVGVTRTENGVTYCYLFTGKPNAINFYG